MVDKKEIKNSGINISKETKERFEKLRLQESAKIGKALTQDEFEIILLNKLTGKKND